jgi:serine protease Do
MASFDPQSFGFDEPPPRPTTPPVRRGFLLVLFVLSLLASLVYGIPYVAERAGYAWEAGRARAATEALAKLDKAGIISRSSELFRMATAAVAPAVVRVETREFPHGRGGQEPGPGIPGRFEGTNLGSGVIIDKDRGFVVTNNHVIQDADEIVVRLSLGNRIKARLVGADPKTDLAVLQIQGQAPVAAQWGDSEKLDIGDWVLAIGSPFALDHTVTAGIVSATQRNDLRINDYESFIQTDAAINPGNSGGPLIDLSGKVIGINTAIYTTNQSQGNEGIGLAIPSSMARSIVESLIKDGRVVRGYLGVGIEELTAASAKNLGVPDTRGVVVTEVRSDSPAAQAGLQSGDVITRLAGKDVPGPFELRNLTASLAVGSKVPLRFYREGKTKTVDVTIAEYPSAPELASSGFRLRDVPPEEGNDPDGSLVIDQIVRDSPAFRAGLRPGLKIIAVGRTRVHNQSEFEAAVAALGPDQGLPLVVERPDGQAAQVIIGGPPPRPRR